MALCLPFKEVSTSLRKRFHGLPSLLKRPLWRRLLILGIVLGSYPAFVLVYTWSFVLASELPGGKNGPLDAYRHALASSVVSYTLGESAVDLVTLLMEAKGRDSNLMDRHNNRVGSRIGSQVKTFSELEPAIRQAVSIGAMNAADPQQITWLPEKKWRKARWW